MTEIVRDALIVAVAAYSDRKLRQLRAPAVDAEQLARVLRNPSVGDFRVEVTSDVREGELRRRLAQFFANRRPDDLLLVHFSCHGVKDESGELYLAATDTESDVLAATGVASGWLNDRIGRCRSKRIVVLLDCCFSGSFPFESRMRADEQVNIQDHLGGRGRAIITASNSMEFSYEGDELSGAGQPSFFTGAVVEALETGKADRDGDGRISVDELYDYVYDRVRERTPNQSPTILSSLEGPLYIARSSYRSPIEPGTLPRELLALIESHFASARVVAVEELANLLKSSDRSVVLAARDALEPMLGDDSRSVSTRAGQALAMAQDAKTPESPQTPGGEMPAKRQNTHRPVPQPHDPAAPLLGRLSTRTLTSAASAPPADAEVPAADAYRGRAEPSRDFAPVAADRAGSHARADTASLRELGGRTKADRRRESAVPEPEEVPTARRRWPFRAGLAAAAIAAAALGVFLAARSGGAHASTFRSDNLVLTGDSQWHTANRQSVPVSGLKLRSPISIATGSVEVLAGTITTPSAVAASVPRTVSAVYGKPSTVEIRTLPLGPLRAYSWPANGRQGALVLMLVATAAGETAIACRPATSSSTAEVACSSVAAEARIVATTVEYPGADPVVQRKLATALKPLAAIPSRTLKVTALSPLMLRTAGFDELARLDADAAAAVAAVGTTRRYSAATAGLATALRQESAAMNVIARAAHSNRSREYVKARSNLVATGRSVTSAIGFLHSRGFVLPAPVIVVPPLLPGSRRAHSSAPTTILAATRSSATAPPAHKAKPPAPSPSPKLKPRPQEEEFNGYHGG